MPAQPSDWLTVGLAQIAPVWLNRDATLAKIVDYIGRAALPPGDIRGSTAAMLANGRPAPAERGVVRGLMLRVPPGAPERPDWNIVLCRRGERQ